MCPIILLVMTILTACPGLTSAELIKPLRVPIGLLLDGNLTSADEAVRKFLSTGGPVTRELNFAVHAQQVNWKDEYDILRAANVLMDNKSVIALVIPRLSPVLVQLSIHRRVPLISLRSSWTRDVFFGLTTEVMPNLLRPVIDLMRFSEWSALHYLYTTDQGLSRFSELQQLVSYVLDLHPIVPHRLYRPDHAHTILKRLDVAHVDSRIFVILDMEPDAAANVLSEAYQATHLDRDKIRFIYVQPADEDFWKEQALEDLHVTGFMIYTTSAISEESPFYAKNVFGFKTDWLLGRDAALLIKEACSRFYRNQEPLFRLMVKRSPQQRKKSLPSGDLLYKYITDTYVSNGSTPGPLQFEARGIRKAYSVDVIRTTASGSRKAFVWSDVSGLNPLEPTTRYVDRPFNISGKKLIFSSIQASPFLMSGEREGLKTNSPFHGYIPDLLDQLSHMLGFTYQIKLVADNKYGYLRKNGTWSGIIGELLRNEVDVAAAPLTMTADRQMAVQFSHPFMQTGISMLVKRPVCSDLGIVSPGLANFYLSPFTPELWGYLVAAMAVVGAGHFFIGRWLVKATSSIMTHELPPKTTSLLDSYWFTFGSFLLRHTRLVPNFVTNRFLSGVWWVFSFFVLALYVTNLVSLLVTSVQGTCGKRREVQMLAKSTLSVLQESLDHGFPEVGLVAEGATHNFFKTSKDPLLSRYYSFVTRKPDLRTTSYQEGVRRVRENKGNFAFFMESTANEYVIRSDCRLLMLPQQLSSQGYGLATTKDSPLMRPLNRAILKLIESGHLRRLKDKWWKSHTTCPNSERYLREHDPEEGGYVKPMKLSDVLGVFYVLLTGLALTVLVLAAEALKKSRGNARIHSMGLDSPVGGSELFIADVSLQAVERTAL